MQKPFLSRQTSGIAGQAAVAPDDPMAGDQDGNRVMAHRAAYRLGAANVQPPAISP